jgi:hypothetical protein
MAGVRRACQHWQFFGPGALCEYIAEALDVDAASMALSMQASIRIMRLPAPQCEQWQSAGGWLSPATTGIACRAVRKVLASLPGKCFLPGR